MCPDHRSREGVVVRTEAGEGSSASDVGGFVDFVVELEVVRSRWRISIWSWCDFAYILETYFAKNRDKESAHDA